MALRNVGNHTTAPRASAAVRVGSIDGSGLALGAVDLNLHKKADIGGPGKWSE